MNLENIRKVYNAKESTVIALDKISYNFKLGTFYAIMGHSGSGKSTLLKILGLIENYTSGKYILNDVDVTKLNDKELSKIRMKKIGFIFQDYLLDNHLKAYENIILPMLINKDINAKDRKATANHLLEKIGLSERANHFPKELSGGEQQRICLARALANNPDYILADEPTGNLDLENELLIFEELKMLAKKGKCIIVVTHSNEIKKYADEIILIEKGKLI